jgi:threonine aldolase
MSTEAIVVFNRELVDPLSYHLRRVGQIWSKMRFAAVQLMAYVEDGLFLHLAEQANGLATRLAREISALYGIGLIAPVEANLVFLSLPESVIEKIAAEDILFERLDRRKIRLVTRFDGQEADIDRLLNILRHAVRTSARGSP